MFTPRRLLAAVCATGLLAGTGCAAAPHGSSEPAVVAAFYPLAWAVEEVGGADVRLTNLTTPGVEPHDLELNVRQTAAISAADLVVYEQDFQASVDQAIANNTDHGFDVSGTVDLHRTPDGPDPHFWQDPLRMAAYVEALGGRLAAIDADHASAYRQRAASLGGTLRDLDAAYTAGLGSCAVHTIVVSHDAFNYLGKYAVRVVGIAGLTPEAEPSARHISQLQDLVRSDHITTIFSETLAPKKLAETIAHDTGVRSEVLDPIEGVSKDAPAGTDYLSLMRSNLITLEKANQCR